MGSNIGVCAANKARAAVIDRTVNFWEMGVL